MGVVRMSICPSCGRGLNQGERFCASCGFDTQGQVPPGQPLYPTKKPVNKQNTTLIIVVVIVVAVVVVGLIVAAMAMNSVVDDLNDDEIGIVVHDAHVSYDGWFLEDGYKYVVYNVTVTNNKSSEMTFSILNFELHTVSGLNYMPSFSAGTPMNTPESLSAGSSYTLILAYEIMETDSGARIVYDWVFDHGSAPVPL